MVPMPVGPDDCFNFFAIDAVFFKLFADAIFNCDLPVTGFHALSNSGSEVLEVFPYAQVKKHFAA